MHARTPGFFLGDRKPPLRLSAIFFCLLICPGPCNNLDPLLKFLYETPPSECTKPPLLNPGSAPELHIKMGETTSVWGTYKPNRLQMAGGGAGTVPTTHIISLLSRWPWWSSWQHWSRRHSVLDGRSRCTSMGLTEYLSVARFPRTRLCQTPKPLEQSGRTSVA